MDLQASAARLAELIPRDSLHPQALACVDRLALAGGKWTVAFSGGVDSVATLLLVWAHWPEQRKNLIAAHFNHSLRGAESDRDQEFCQDLASRLEVEFRTARWAHPPAEASEGLARQQRWAFFEETLAASGSGVILTGHHLDDVLETQLMRLGRGSGTGGMSAPRPVRTRSAEECIVRPLLNLTKKEIVEAATQAGLGWVEDSTNSADCYLRNKVRQYVVPAWIQAVGPSGFQGVALSRELLQEDDEALDDWVKTIAPLDENGALNLGKLRGKPAAVWRRALRLWLGGHELSRPGFTQLMLLAQSGRGQMSLGSRTVVADKDKLSWSNLPGPPLSWESCRLILDTDLFLPSGGMLHATRVTVDAGLRHRLDKGEIDERLESFTAVTAPVIIRSWKAGDQYCPLGAPGSAKLQDLFVNRKVSRYVRHNLPLICRPDGRIIWVPHLPPADDSKIGTDTVTALQLTYTPGTSTLSD